MSKLCGVVFRIETHGQYFHVQARTRTRNHLLADIQFEFLKHQRYSLINPEVVKPFLDYKSYGKPKNVDNKRNQLNRGAVIFYFSELICVTIISFSNVFLIQSCKERNAKNGINEVCGMVGRIWLPFDYDYFPLKPIVFAYEVCILSGLFMSSVFLFSA